MNYQKNLLRIDGFSGITVGIFMLLLPAWLSGFYQLPLNLVLFIGTANLMYGAYSLSLSLRMRRPMVFVIILVCANFAWAIVCIILLSMYWPTAGVFGLLHIIAEGVYVSILGSLEWRYRTLLAT